jgi:hypothetical protein
MRRPRATAVQACRAQPVAPPAERIDHRKAARHGRSCRGGVACERHETGGSSRKRLIGKVSILAQPGVDSIRRKEEQGPVRSTDDPTAIPRDSQGASFVPREGPLDPTEIMDLGLDLDHEHGPRGEVKCQDVDPARPVPAIDLDLGLDDPTQLSKSGRDIRNAAGMDAVALACSIREERRLERQPDRAAKRCRDPLDLVEA